MVQSISNMRPEPSRPSGGGGRVPPHNIEAEESLLGAMLLSKDAIASAVETVRPEDFYKPAHGHWRSFYETTDADRERHVHVAQSHFHDIAPAHELGIPSIWINRLDERPGPEPTRELPDLTRLPETLDEVA